MYQDIFFVVSKLLIVFACKNYFINYMKHDEAILS